MKPLRMGPWPVGLCNRFAELDVPKGGLVVADDVDIDREGAIDSRDGYETPHDTVTCLFEHGDTVYGLKAGFVGYIQGDIFIPVVETGAAKVAWSLLDSEPMFIHPMGVGTVSKSGGSHLGTENAFIPIATATTGSLEQGRYGVAVTNNGIDGEGGMSGVAFFEGTGADIILLPAPLDVHERVIYMTHTNGETLYEIGRLPAGTNTLTVMSKPNYRKQADTLGMVRMPGGNYARQWNGRLLVARGTSLLYSPAYRYGLFSPRSDFIRFHGRIAFIEPVDNGVFVGIQGRGVEFLAGNSPAEWQQKPASGVPPQPGCSGKISTELMDQKLQASPEVAVWFTESGFALGMPDGSVVMPQADRLSGLPLGVGDLVVQGDRLIALSQ